MGQPELIIKYSEFSLKKQHFERNLSLFSRLNKNIMNNTPLYEVFNFQRTALINFMYTSIRIRSEIKLIG